MLAALLAAETAVYALLVAAGEGPSATDFINVGVVGVVLLAVITRKWLVPAWVLTEAQEEIARLRADNAALRQAYEEKADRTMGALTEAVEELTKTAAVPPPRRRP